MSVSLVFLEHMNELSAALKAHLACLTLPQLSLCWWLYTKVVKCAHLGT